MWRYDLNKAVKETNIIWQSSRISLEDRERLLGQRGCVVWLTGLSGSGKSTIACMLEEQLVRCGHPACVLDGDNVRHGLNRDLGFSAEDRRENIRRIGEVAALLARSGMIAITSFISPYRAGRDTARQALDDGIFIEIYLDTPLEECEKRDPKGLYQRARVGEIVEFTGIDAPYEPPRDPEMILHTHKMSLQECVEAIWDYLLKRGVLCRPEGQVKTQEFSHCR